MSPAVERHGGVGEIAPRAAPRAASPARRRPPRCRPRAARRGADGRPSKGTPRPSPPPFTFSDAYATVQKRRSVRWRRSASFSLRSTSAGRALLHAERAQRVAGERRDGGGVRTLPAHVAHHDAPAVRGVEHVVEVAADLDGLAGGVEARGDLGAGNLGQLRRQQALLQRPRDVAALAVEARVVDRDRRAPPELLGHRQVARGRSGAPDSDSAKAIVPSRRPPVLIGTIISERTPTRLEQLELPVLGRPLVEASAGRARRTAPSRRCGRRARRPRVARWLGGVLARAARA